VIRFWQYLATRFAATLRRKLYRGTCRISITNWRAHDFPEHLGLISPQPVAAAHEPVDSFMRPAPHPNADETTLRIDALVADPLSDEVLSLWEGTAKKNREIFTEVFRPVPSNLVQNWQVYKVRRDV
jgi:phospholipase D1/2